MKIYLLPFYLFDDIKNIGITHANHSTTPKAISTKLHVLPGRLYFLLAFCARHYPWLLLCQKNTIKNYFIQLKLLFWSLDLATSLLFEEMFFLTFH